MRVFRDPDQLPAFKNAVITIGSFDGIHLGHQSIIRQIQELARAEEGESVLITFFPHPRQVVYPSDKSLQLLCTQDEKIFLLQQLGLDNLVIIPFTVEFSQMSADEYVEKLLIEKFNPRYVVIGYDHRFGTGRQGDVHYLQWHAKKAGFEVKVIEKQEVDDIAISSTKIRRALEEGDISRANQLLGYPYLLSGKVVPGESLGRKMGFPTANLALSEPNKLLPPNAIYAVWVRHRGKRYGGMLYMGDRPSLRHLNNKTIEVHIFDFQEDIYGQELILELEAFLRWDVRFNNLMELQTQLKKDEDAARAVLKEAEKKKSGRQPPTAIVILNYNGRSFLEQFLPTLLETCPDYARVIVADNASTDDSLLFLEENYPDLEVIRLPENYGFAEGYNQALRQIEGFRYLVLLNSDIQVTPQWLEPLVKRMESDPAVAACQPKIRSFTQPQLFEYAGASGGWLDNLGYPFCRGRLFHVTEGDRGQYDEAAEIFWATGAAFCVRRELFTEAGGFDKDYFAHLEEIDLCWRLKSAGYSIWVQPDSVVYHMGGGTLNYNTPRKSFLNFRNSLYTLVKNEPMGKLLWLLPLRFCLDALAALLFLSKWNLAHIGAIFRAHWSFFRHLPATWRKRKQVREIVNRIGRTPRPNRAGRYRGSIVWGFYARGKQTFAQYRTDPTARS